MPLETGKSHDSTQRAESADHVLSSEERGQHVFKVKLFAVLRTSTSFSMYLI